MWPGKISETKNRLPVNAMGIQAVIVSVIITLIASGRSTMAAFFNILVSMTNVAMTIPYVFIALAFPYFKKKTEIIKPFIIFKTQKSANFWAWVVILTVGLANFFSIIQPALEGDIQTTIWSVAGPILFSVVAWLMYSKYERLPNP
ncbi:hypothetical protein [Neobacillus drentensis]|uniref:hypothetical protein n=1 Tax=Neobacillus drentensis TaxID=220684 RepID=UPI003002BFBC